MFGRKEPKKRSLEDMFVKTDEDVSKDCVEERDIVSVESEKEEKHDGNEDFVNEPLKPLDCFVMEEEKTEKWLMKCVKFWYCIMSFVWFLLGALTFAPIIFISNKVNVIFKHKKKSFLCASVIYFVFAVLLFVFLFIR